VLLSTHGIPLLYLRNPMTKSQSIFRVKSIPTLCPQMRRSNSSAGFFPGRDDVYPIRWESQQSGKVGYSPVCANEWRHGICEKPRIKCGECNHSLYVPVTDHVIFRHLNGEITAGIYPLLAGDRCYFLAIEFGCSA
jgi:hypothetical protein